MGVRRMNRRPGIVRKREMAKYHLRFPTMSNTPAHLSPQRGPPARPGDELGLGDAVQAGLSRPVLGDDDAQDRPGQRDRAEHGGEDADDEDEREALDDRRSEQ